VSILHRSISASPRCSAQTGTVPGAAQLIF
jgi:hypothetical protein